MMNGFAAIKSPHDAVKKDGGIMEAVRRRLDGKPVAASAAEAIADSTAETQAFTAIRLADERLGRPCTPDEIRNQAGIAARFALALDALATSREVGHKAARGETPLLDDMLSDLGPGGGGK
jgi:hypothetical protein